MRFGRLAVGERLRLASTSASAVSAAAASAVRAAPGHRLRLCLLGPLELHRDDQPVSHPDLRRERVRQMLGYLAMPPPSTPQRGAAERAPALHDQAARSPLH